jgi:hypothetical protein
MRDNVPCEFPAGYDGTAVLERLAQVLDPELDESILDLGFVRTLELRSGHASVALRLPGGFTANEIDDLARVGERLAVVIDRHSQWWITRNVLSAYLGARTGPKVLAGQIRRDWRDQQHYIAAGRGPPRSAPPATPARVAFVG